MIVLRQKPLPEKSSSALDFLSGISAIPGQIAQAQAYQTKTGQAAELNAAKVGELNANARKIGLESDGIQQKQESISALPDSFETLYRGNNGLPATGPAGNLVSLPLEPSDIGSAYSNILLPVASVLSHGVFAHDRIRTS